MKPNKKQKCSQLSKEITELRNQLAKRIGDLMENKHNLPKFGKQSLAGHVQQYGNKAQRLRNLLDQYQTLGCDNDSDSDDGCDTPDDAWKYATSKKHQKFQPEKGPQVSPAVIAGFLGVTVACVFAFASSPATASVLGAIALFQNLG